MWQSCAYAHCSRSSPVASASSTSTPGPSRCTCCCFTPTCACTKDQQSQQNCMWLEKLNTYSNLRNYLFIYLFFLASILVHALQDSHPLAVQFNTFLKDFKKKFVPCLVNILFVLAAQLTGLWDSWSACEEEGGSESWNLYHRAKFIKQWR